MSFFFKWIASPVGQLKLAAQGYGLAAILWEQDSAARVRLGTMEESPGHPVLVETERQLAEFFRVIGASGDLTGFAGGLEAKRYLLALEKRA